jgi:hypothetical protein
MTINTLLKTLKKAAYLVLPYRPFQYLFCEILNNLAYRRDISIRQSIDISQKRILLDIIKPLTVS